MIKNTNHASRTAHCLLEISFIDRQPVEEARLADPSYIADLGRAIRDGIMQYLADAGLFGESDTEIDADLTDVRDEPEDAASAMAHISAAELAIAAPRGAPMVRDGLLERISHKGAAARTSQCRGTA